MRTGILVLLLLGSTVMANGDTLSLSIRWDNLTANATAQSVAIHRNRAIAGLTLNNNTEVSIRGYNATTGNLVWEDRFPGFAPFGRGIFVEASQDYAIALASIPDPDIDHPKLFLRGYDLHSGAIRWTTAAQMFSPQNILIRNGKLVIVGYDGRPVPTDFVHGVLLVFDASTGAFLWNAALDIDGLQTEFWDVDDAGKNIVVVGTENTGLVPNLFVRSYRLRDGRLRWEVTEPTVFASVIRVQNDLAYVAGFEATSGGSNPTFLAAYRVGDGVRQWKAAGFSGFFTGPFTSLAASETAVIAGGFNLIEAHDPLTGSVLWSRVVPFPDEEVPRRLIPIGDRTVTVGTKAINPPGFDQQLVIRILDAAGQVVAEDLREIGPFNSYFDAALLNDRLAVVGRIGGIAGGALVRVYDIETQRATRWQDSFVSE